MGTMVGIFLPMTDLLASELRAAIVEAHQSDGEKQHSEVFHRVKSHDAKYFTAPRLRSALMKGDRPMVTYIVLINYTQQGIENVKDGPGRLVTAKEAAKAMGGEIKAFYLTMGRYDLIAVIEAPDDESVAKLMLSFGSGGAIRTETLRAFTEDSYRQIIGSLA
jgi:uncharacterized protein with GYD domain